MHKIGRFAIVTPYAREPREVLERCVESVRTQTISADHFFVSDGFPQDWLDQAGVKHIRLGHAHHDFGNTPRGIGALLAVSQGYDAIGFLDADNWYDREHVCACCDVAHSAAPADVVIAKRRMLLGDGTPLAFPEEPGHVDTNCFWFLSGAFHLLHYWANMPPPFAPFGDRVFNRMIHARRLTVRHAQATTVNYVSGWAGHYRAVGKTPPPSAKPNIDVGPAVEWICGLDPRQQRLVANRCGVHPIVVWAEVISRPAIDRDANCPCGSGDRYLRCHGDVAVALN